jgi:methionyl-tRNA synthetase
MKSFYITTPIYYVNDVPHLGHAYTTMVADAFARFHRMIGDQVQFLTGTDEHGAKVQETAVKRGMSAQQLVDEVAPRFEETWRALGISRHGFIRTTEARHKHVVTELWKRIRARNPDDLYLATYEGWYCVGCEAFYTESQLVKDGETWTCPVHSRPVDWVAKERSWFFRMSRYAEALQKHIEQHPHFIQPEQYRNEVLGFLKEGLRDLSVSRTSFDWGIEVPEPDPEGKKHVIYVWMDALTNYVSALGGFDPETEDYRTYWRSTVHLIGKDILRFHAVFWPCFLMAAELPLPRTVLCHGWWNIGGRKISKSIPATRVNPVELAADLGETSSVPATGIDALRYFLMRETPLGKDGDLVYENLLERYDADLANDLGNLINRVLKMANDFGAAAPPRRHDELSAQAEGPHTELRNVARDAARDARMAWEGFTPSKALEATWRLVKETNRYIDTTQPWILARQGKTEILAHVLHSLLSSLWWLRRMIQPVLPTTARVLDGWLGTNVPEEEARWPDPEAFGLDLPPLTLQAATPLYPRTDAKRRDVLIARWLPEAVSPVAPVDANPGKPESVKKKAKNEPQPESRTSAPATTPEGPAADGALTFDEFMKVELRVGQVVAAQAVPKAKKLLQLTVDLGEAQPRTVVSGIAQAYTPEQMIGRRLILVTNLAPRVIGGIRSEGMILAAGDDTILGLSALDRDVPPGTRVR